MYDDVESDFWKEQICQMQQKNLHHKDFDRLSMSECKSAFEKFSLLHPELHVETTFSASCATMEFFVTEDVKFRLFVQNQVKGSFLQKIDGDLVKIADAKFPNNPFFEINDFLEQNQNLKCELAKIKKNSVINQKKKKIAGEFIKAQLIRKIGEKVSWNLLPAKSGFTLKIKNDFANKNQGQCEESFLISEDNFKTEIKKIFLSE